MALTDRLSASGELRGSDAATFDRSPNTPAVPGSRRLVAFVFIPVFGCAICAGQRTVDREQRSDLLISCALQPSRHSD
jgi:hypothetical protein